MYKITIIDSFSAAHYLRNYDGKCENLHGHNWKIQVHVSGTVLDKAGMLIDFGVVKKALKKILLLLDHKNLNEEVEFFQKENPSSENIARFLFEKLEELINSENYQVQGITVYETDTSYCTYTKD